MSGLGYRLQQRKQSFTLEDELRAAFARSLVRLAVTAAQTTLTQNHLNELQDQFEAAPTLELIREQEQYRYVFLDAFASYRGANQECKELHRRYTFCFSRWGKIRCTDSLLTHLNIYGLSLF